MLAYVFWHGPAGGADVGEYERAQIAFQRSLARKPPFGFRGSAVFRVGSLPWSRSDREQLGADPMAYEDWYLIDDFAALGVLNEAAVGRGHRTSHDRAARAMGSGTAGLYRLIEGTTASAQGIGRCAHVTWVKPEKGRRQSEIATMLGDGLDDAGGTLWQRQLVLGPAPEFCLLSCEEPPGAAPRRLAGHWSATSATRETVFGD
jgi:hypothetical protein